MSDKIDPGLFTIIRSIYDNIAKEMSIALERSAWSSVIALCRDFSVVILDDAFRLITVPEEILPGQAMSLHNFVKNMAGSYGDDLHEGDVLMSNDCDIGNLHAAEIAFTTPVFHEGEIMFWTAVRGHMLDMGAPVPMAVYPWAKDAYQEGLTIPPVKVYEKGVQKKDIINLYLQNTRFNSINYGDLMAHVASILLGRDRLLEFITRYGKEVIKRYTEELFDYTDRMVGAEIRSMKPGTYYGEDWIDTNGFGTKNIPIKVKLAVEGDMWIVDLSDCPSAMIGTANCGIGMTEGVVASSLGYCMDAKIPKNWGLCKHYRIIAPENCIVNAKRPFSTARGTSAASDILYHALLKAAAGACIEKVPAGYTKCVVQQLAGTDYRDGRNKEWGYVALGEQAGGGGAAFGADGSSCVLDFEVVGGLKAIPFELAELLFPIIIENAEIATDSMGAGKWRGAPGRMVTVTPYECSRLLVGSDHGELYNGCYGLSGGKQSPGGCVYYYDAKAPQKRTFHSMGVFYVNPACSYVSISTGGGGYGDPLERNPEMVWKDVRDGIVSESSAEADYGVKLDPLTKTLDRDATKELRNKIRSELGELPLLTATEPGNATMTKRMMGGDDIFIDTDRDPDIL